MIFHDDELDDELKNKLSLMASTPPRSLENATRGREVFMNQARDLQSRTPPLVIAKRPNKGFLQTLFGRRSSFAPFAIALMITIGLIFGGWGTVYAAQDSLPNDFLYPVKLAAENVRITFTANAETKVALLTTYTGSRIDEAATLASQGEPIPEELPTLMDEQLDELFTLTASLDDAATQEALEGIQRHLRDQDQVMTNAMRSLPEGVDPQLTRLLAMLKERQQLVQMGVGEPNTFQQQFRHQVNKPILPVTATLTSTITSTLTTTPEITVTLTITTGQYGPGPCEEPGDCTPPGPSGTPVPGEENGFGPGPDQGVGPNQPTVTPMNGEPKNMPASSSNKSKMVNKP